jgi:hypothetical protein
MAFKKGETAGAKNSRWKGGIKYHAYGYRLIASPNHPNKDKQGYVREHRLVMEGVLGRLLLPTEDIHHKDGNKLNNTPDNLELFSGRREHLIARHRNGGMKTWFQKGQPSLNPKNGKDISCQVCSTMFYVPKSLVNKRKVCNDKSCKVISVSNSLKKYYAKQKGATI